MRVPWLGRGRGGFALHVVLWVMIAAAAVALAGQSLGRDAFDAGRNRIALERAHWNAWECSERARAAIDDALGGAADLADVGREWRTLNQRLAGARLLLDAQCHVTAEAAGTRVDVNAVPGDLIVSLLSELTGSEVAMDVGQRLVARRETRPFADMREVARVPGVAGLGVDSAMTTEPGRISIATAPAQVLAAVPGFTPEAVELIVDLRDRGDQITDLLALAGQLSSSASSAMLAHYAEIARLTTVDPDAWILTATGRAPASEVSAAVEIRIVRADRKAVVVRYRSWP